MTTKKICCSMRYIISKEQIKERLLNGHNVAFFNVNKRSALLFNFFYYNREYASFKWYYDIRDHKDSYRTHLFRSDKAVLSQNFNVKQVEALADYALESTRERYGILYYKTVLDSFCCATTRLNDEEIEYLLLKSKWYDKIKEYLENIDYLVETISYFSPKRGCLTHYKRVFNLIAKLFYDNFLGIYSLDKMI